MEKLWWMRKQQPAQDYEDDVNGYYYGNDPKNEDDVTSEENGYDSYEGGDVSEVQVALSGDPIKEIAKAEPLMKKTFAPKSCQDSREIVDAYKDGRVVVICVEELDRENFLRLFDYVMGAVQALDGDLHRLNRDTVVLLPYGVDEDLDVDTLEEVAEEAAEEAENEEA